MDLGFADVTAVMVGGERGMGLPEATMAQIREAISVSDCWVTDPCAPCGSHYR
jgi:hypothetical protein